MGGTAFGVKSTATGVVVVLVGVGGVCVCCSKRLFDPPRFFTQEVAPCTLEHRARCMQELEAIRHTPGTGGQPFLLFRLEANTSHFTPHRVVVSARRAASWITASMTDAPALPK